MLLIKLTSIDLQKKRSFTNTKHTVKQRVCYILPIIETKFAKNGNERDNNLCESSQSTSNKIKFKDDAATPTSVKGQHKHTFSFSTGIPEFAIK